MKNRVPIINLIPALALLEQLRNESLDELRFRAQPHIPRDNARVNTLINEMALLRDVRDRTRVTAILAVTDGGDC